VSTKYLIKSNAQTPLRLTVSGCTNSVSHLSGRMSGSNTNDLSGGVVILVRSEIEYERDLTGVLAVA
jgi:hypothetical protein